MTVTAALTRFQRILLGTDGTVTHILEAYAGEPIEVVKLLQTFDVSDDGDADLLIADGEAVLRRQVLLRGRRSNRTLLYAEVVVIVARVQPGLIEGLVETDKPIGTLLREGRTETLREVLFADSEPAGTCAVHFDIDPDADLIFRTYRIVAGGQPIIMVTEKFPAHFFREVPP